MTKWQNSDIIEKLDMKLEKIVELPNKKIKLFLKKVLTNSQRCVIINNALAKKQSSLCKSE